MPVVVPYQLRLAPESPDAEIDEEDDDMGGFTKCARWRLSFVRHPSIGPGDASKWRLCSPCRSRLLGKGTQAKSLASGVAFPGKRMLVSNVGGTP